VPIPLALDIRYIPENWIPAFAGMTQSLNIVIPAKAGIQGF